MDVGDRYQRQDMLVTVRNIDDGFGCFGYQTQGCDQDQNAATKTYWIITNFKF